MSKSIATPAIDELIRINSLKGRLYLALKDGKKHSVKVVNKMLTDAGLVGHYCGVLYALARILRTNMSKTIVFENRGKSTATLQIVEITKANPYKRQARTVAAQVVKPKKVRKASKTAVAQVEELVAA